ncbi:hypothetical protein LTR53_018425, partial [Teratosphaeriaceae sp. CCFEE 6253]
GVAPQGTGYEMDDMHSMYSSVKPASTILTQMGGMGGMYRPPPSPNPYQTLNRASTYSRYTDNPQHAAQLDQQRLMSMGGLSDHYAQQQQQQQLRGYSQTDLLAAQRSPPMYQPRAPSPLPYGQSRPASTHNLTTTLPGFQTQGVSNEVIGQAIRECLQEVDMDAVTKKQVKALVEQRLQCQLVGEKRAYLDAQIDVELANM